jgi:hypothetical protein
METNRATVTSVIDELPQADLPHLEQAFSQVLSAARQVHARSQKDNHTYGLPASR